MIINDSKINEKVKKNGNDQNKIKRSLLAFFFGGFIGLIGQSIYLLINNNFNISKDNSTLLVSIIMVTIAFLLTCFGLFDKLACIAYCGISIPITGFSNSITSSALEGKSEGLIFGIGSKIFSLIGSVTTYGIVSSIILGIIYFLINKL